MKIKMTGNDWFWVNFQYENVPNFCFICGVMGHTERFCSQLFEKPEQDIVKPYGAWLRAPFRRHVKPIGSKWLHNGDSSNSSNSQVQSHDNPDEDDADSLDPKITPANMIVVTQRVNQGDRIFQTEYIGAG